MRPLALLYEELLSYVASVTSAKESASDAELRLKWVEKERWVRLTSPNYSRLLPVNALKRRPLVSGPGGKDLSCLLRFLADVDVRFDNNGDSDGLNAMIGLLQTPEANGGPAAFSGTIQVMKWCDELLGGASGSGRLTVVAPLLAHQLAWLKAETLTRFVVRTALKTPLSSGTSTSCSTNHVKEDDELVAAILMRPSAPRLIQLPDRYEQLFAVYGGIGQDDAAICAQCSQRPRNPALCLLCGAFVCVNNVCCVTKSPGVRIRYELTQVNT